MSAINDPAFWSTIIALLAVVLSQLPPLQELFKRRSVRIITPEYLTLYHYLGNLNWSSYVALHNTGGRAVTVTKIDSLITDNDGAQWDLPAQTYFSRQSAGMGQSPPELFMEWIELKPGGHWGETVHFYKLWSTQDEDDAGEVIAKIRTNINAKLVERRPGNSQGPVEADEDLVKEAKGFFEKRFKLVKGNFRLLLAALSDKNEVVSVRGFDFTLFESQIRALRAATDDYKIGAGIYFANTDQSRLAIVRMRPCPDAEARELYTRLRPV